MAATANQPCKNIKTYTSADDQQRNGEDLQLAEVVEKLRTAVEDLVLLDASLCDLFRGAPNTNVTEHQQLVQFRSRVARRISRYGQLLKNLNQQTSGVYAHLSLLALRRDSQGAESLTPQQLKQIEEVLKLHQHRLQQYKSQFAAWWHNTERHFHTMRMASYVTSVQGQAQVAAEKESSKSLAIGLQPLKANAAAQQQQEEAALSTPPKEANKAQQLQQKQQQQQQQHSQQLLQQTRKLMQQEVQRMHATQEQLQQSSGILQQTEATFNGLRLIQNLFGSRSSSFCGAAHSSS